MKFIYYDTETTGIKPDTDRVIELAAYDPLEDRTFCQLIHPGIPIPPEASAIHNITDEMVSSAPSFDEIGKAFIEFCGPEAVLVAHNNDAFDILFLKMEAQRAGLTLPDWPTVDSLKWARKYRPDLPRHSLQFLRQIYGIAENQAHRALDDVKILHQLFSYLIDDLDVTTVLRLMNNTTNGDVMPFGKHQGKSLSEVPVDYLKWLEKQGVFDKPENAALKRAFEKLSS